jgi:hypothetical protein
VRKRVVIGLAVLAVAVVGVYVLSPPRRGTVEHHKEQFLDAHYSGQVAQWIVPRGPRALRVAYFRRKEEQINFHRRALVELGYLGERVFVISNQPSWEVENALRLSVDAVFTAVAPHVNFAAVLESRTNSVRVVAPVNEMQKWEDMIRGLDVPGEGGQ